ncbi:MFS transporter [Rickettsia endosymbiont of Halotydeus destructor]|uniref:MFS transporter n=1 Tax=Rickettsia endosymbiont of Halotydeus destructor TaxID=2996754 RepID=UPI003BB13595
MFNIFKDIRFLLIYIASLNHAISNVVLLIFVSKKILDDTHSLFLSSSVFSIIWVLPIISGSLIAKISNHSRSINVLLINNILNLLLITTTFYITLNDLHILYIIISLRGLLEALNRSTAVTSIKRYIDPKLHQQCFSFFNNSKTLGSFLAGMLLIYIPNINNFIQILNINLINCIISLLCYCYIFFKCYKFDLKNDKAPVLSYSLSRCFQDIVRDKSQLQNLFYIILSNFFFFGYYQISRIFIPSKFEVGSYNHVALFQIIANIAVVLGTVYAATKFKKNTFVLLGIITNCIIISVINYIDTEFLALLLYFTLIFIYQSIYSISLSNILNDTNSSKIGYVITFINIAITLLMIIFISISSICVDFIGYTFTSILISMTCLIILILYEHVPTKLNKKYKNLFM